MNKQIFVTSDWHDGHAKSIEYDNRPFKDTLHMREMLIQNFNKQVPENGLTYFLGDMLAGIEVLKRLNGTKVLVIGNHDKLQQSAYNSGYDVVLNGAVTYIQGQRVTMSHCPLIGIKRECLKHIPEERRKGVNWHGEFKNQAFSFQNEGQFHLHGHLHCRKETKDIKQIIQGRQMDIGVTAHNYRPVHFGVIESWIMKTLKAEREALRHT